MLQSAGAVDSLSALSVVMPLSVTGLNVAIESVPSDDDEPVVASVVLGDEVPVLSADVLLDVPAQFVASGHVIATVVDGDSLPASSAGSEPHPHSATIKIARRIAPSVSRPTEGTRSRLAIE
jgi:hypothetical protein